MERLCENCDGTGVLPVEVGDPVNRGYGRYTPYSPEELPMSEDCPMCRGAGFFGKSERLEDE